MGTLYPHNGLANRRLRPLGHLSKVLHSIVRGGGGIRTLDGDYLPITVFKTVAFNHSATPPPVPPPRERRSCSRNAPGKQAGGALRLAPAPSGTAGPGPRWGGSSPPSPRTPAIRPPRPAP